MKMSAFKKKNLFTQNFGGFLLAKIRISNIGIENYI